MIYDDDIGGGPVSALLGDNPGWLGCSGVGVRGSGIVSRVSGVETYESNWPERSEEEKRRVQEQLDRRLYEVLVLGEV